MISCIAIDDEPHALQLLAGYAAQVTYLKWMGAFRDPLQASAILHSEKIDLLFLDLNMPGLDGMTFYRSLSRRPQVIFTTAYAEFAAESYEVQALDYLLKPIAFPRFLQACNKFPGVKSEVSPPPNLPPVHIDSLYLKSGNKWLVLKWSEVLFVEKSENYIVYHVADKRKILSRQTMNDVMEIVPGFFGRVHKSYVVNINRVESIERDDVSVAGQKLPLTDMYRDAFMKKCGI